MKRIPAYILTIEDRSHPRLKNALAQIAKIDAVARIIKGVVPNGRDFYNSYSPLINLFLLKRSLSAGEICCYIGHRKAWKEFVDEGHSHALIFEDDFCVDDPERFRKNIDDCVSVQSTNEIIKLFDFRPKDISVRSVVGNTAIVAYTYPTSGAVAYIIGRDAAKALLKRQRFYRPVDEDLSHMWEFGIRVWSVHPNPVKLARISAAPLWRPIAD
jgi:glycosyl transferase family 25